jgi:hypothetical protein
MVGGRMVGSWSDVKRGSRPMGGVELRAGRREAPRMGGDRALVVVRKSRNGDGAKEGRKAMRASSQRRERESGIVPGRAERAAARLPLFRGRSSQMTSSVMESAAARFLGRAAAGVDLGETR